MKLLPVFLLFVLAGCQSQPATPVPLPKPALPPVSAVANNPSSSALERKIRQQAQTIEALVSQNEALTAKLNAAVSAAPVPAVAPLPSPNLAPPTPVVATPKVDSSVLAPNADGVIDLAAAAVAAKSGESVNPFAVRTASPEGTREMTLLVGGIVAGPTACAVINDRLLLAGDAIESLLVERIEADAVFLRCGEQRLRLPVSEKPVRVRLPL